MKNLLYILILSILLNSCYTYKPNSYAVSKPNYNNVVEVSNPHYVKKKNAIGYAVTGLTIGGITYASYKYGPIVTNNGVSTEKNNVGNVALGVVTSVATNLLIDKLSGIGSVKSTKNNEDFKDWVDETDNSYNSLPNNRAIPKSQETTYKVKKLADVDDFIYAFNNSQNEENLFKECIKTLNRDELVIVIRKFNNSSNTDDIKKEVIKRSKNVEEFFWAIDNYSSFGKDVEYTAVKIITDFKDVMDFNKKFPKSMYKKEVFLNALKNTKQSDFKSLAEYYPKYKEISKNEIEKIENYQISNFIKLYIKNGKYDATNFFSFADLITPIVFINYDNKFNDIANLYWEDQLKTNLSGNEIIDNIYKLRVVVGIGSIGVREISDDEINGFFKTKLDEQIKNNILVKNEKISKVTSDEEWKHWQYNFTSTKIFQYEPTIDDVAGVYSATILNKSKFDLPIKLTLNAHFYADMKVGGVIGGLANFLSKLTEGRSFDDQLKNFEDLGTTRQIYYDIVKSNNSSNVLMPLKSERSFNSIGFSLMGLYSGKYDIAAKNVNSYLEFADNQINQEIIKQQSENIVNIIKGKYNSNLQSFSGEQYNIENENKKIAQALTTMFQNSNTENHRTDECINCEIDLEKTTFPEEGQALFYTYDKPGKIYMKNKQEYEYYYSSDKKSWLVVTPLFQFNKKYDKFQDMLDYFIEECKEENCKN